MWMRHAWTRESFRCDANYNVVDVNHWYACKMMFSIEKTLIIKVDSALWHWI